MALYITKQSNTAKEEIALAVLYFDESTKKYSIGREKDVIKGKPCYLLLETGEVIKTEPVISKTNYSSRELHIDTYKNKYIIQLTMTF